MSLPRTTPSAAGIDAAGVQNFLDAQASAGLDVHSLIIVRDGAVAVEGWAAPYSPASRQLLYSLSKTFTSAAVGLTVGDGLLHYDDLLVDLFPELVDAEVGPKARSIRLRDALAMATGHSQELYTFTDPLTTAHLRRVFVPEPDGEPGVTFAYNQLATYACARAVERATGRGLLDLLQERLFDPLGSTEAAWFTDADGLPYGFSGLHLTTETIASFFQLLIDKGVRNGVQILPTEWIERHSEIQVLTPRETNPDWHQGYGWQVWRSRHGYRGDGAYGQYGLVLPDHRTVIAMTGEQESMQSLLDLVWEHLLPALDADGSPAADAALSEYLDDWWLPPLSGTTPNKAALTSDDGWGGQLTFDGELLTWTDADGVDNSVAVAPDEWSLTQWRWPHGKLPVAASAKQEGNKVLVEVLLTSTPHRFIWTLQPGQPAHFSWRYPPLHSVDPRDLALP